MASNFGVARYGTDQTAISGNGNEIATHKGGRLGGIGFEAAALPAALLLANNVVKRKGYTYPNYKIKRTSGRRPRRSSRRARRSNRSRRH